MANTRMRITRELLHSCKGLRFSIVFLLLKLALMKSIYTNALLLFVAVINSAQAQNIPSAAQQIELALKAVPEAYRESATVLGYNPQGELITLRKGSNTMVALADDPQKDGFSVACYHKDLEPFMARGRELRAQGKDFRAIREIRGKEIKAGTLPMPDKSTLYIYSGKYNAATGKVADGYLRYVIYIPFATSGNTGLPESPTSAGGPWIMDPGTHRAHIMVSPPKK